MPTISTMKTDKPADRERERDNYHGKASNRVQPKINRKNTSTATHRASPPRFETGITDAASAFPPSQEVTCVFYPTYRTAFRVLSPHFACRRREAEQGAVIISRRARDVTVREAAFREVNGETHRHWRRQVATLGSNIGKHWQTLADSTTGFGEWLRIRWIRWWLG